MGTDNGTGWDCNKRTLFDEIVVNYDKVRWEYPSKLFAEVIRYSEPEKGKKALEIGAGPGKATTPFLDTGYVVTAVEMGANMANYIFQLYIGRKL